MTPEGFQILFKLFYLLVLSFSLSLCRTHLAYLSAPTLFMLPLTQVSTTLTKVESGHASLENLCHQNKVNTAHLIIGTDVVQFVFKTGMT